MDIEEQEMEDKEASSNSTKANKREEQASIKDSVDPREDGQEEDERKSEGKNKEDQEGSIGDSESKDSDSKEGEIEASSPMKDDLGTDITSIELSEGNSTLDPDLNEGTKNLQQSDTAKETDVDIIKELLGQDSKKSQSAGRSKTLPSEKKSDTSTKKKKGQDLAGQDNGVVGQDNGVASQDNGVVDQDNGVASTDEDLANEKESDTTNKVLVFVKNLLGIGNKEKISDKIKDDDLKELNDETKQPKLANSIQLGDIDQRSKPQFEVYVVKIDKDGNEKIFKINDPELAAKIIENIGGKDKIQDMCTNNPDGIASFTDVTLEDSIEKELANQINQKESQNISKKSDLEPEIVTVDVKDPTLEPEITTDVQEKVTAPEITTDVQELILEPEVTIGDSESKQLPAGSDRSASEVEPSIAIAEQDTHKNSEQDLINALSALQKTEVQKGSNIGDAENISKVQGINTGHKKETGTGRGM